MCSRSCSRRLESCGQQGSCGEPAWCSKPARCGEQACCGERACPALGCAAAPKPFTAVCQGTRAGLTWGRFAAQRGASPLATRSPLATGVPLGTPSPQGTTSSKTSHQ
ncbi:hypothetical protein C7U57_17365 [Pseudomonas sp. R9.37]|nr:hypothetical protein C7U57_17365 [Pseudomonas sp. R9.37]